MIMFGKTNAAKKINFEQSTYKKPDDVGNFRKKMNATYG